VGLVADELRAWGRIVGSTTQAGFGPQQIAARVWPTRALQHLGCLRRHGRPHGRECHGRHVMRACTQVQPHARAHAGMHTHRRTHSHTYMHARTHARTLTHTQARTHTHALTRARAHKHTQLAGWASCSRGCLPFVCWVAVHCSALQLCAAPACHSGKQKLGPLRTWIHGGCTFHEHTRLCRVAGSAAPCRAPARVPQPTHTCARLLPLSTWQQERFMDTKRPADSLP